MHRQSYETMVRYEVPLLLWENEKTMHGPGTSEYVAMLEKLFKLGNSELREEIYGTIKLSLQDTALRNNFGVLRATTT